MTNHGRLLGEAFDALKKHEKGDFDGDVMSIIQIPQKFIFVLHVLNAEYREDFDSNGNPYSEEQVDREEHYGEMDEVPVIIDQRHLSSKKEIDEYISRLAKNYQVEADRISFYAINENFDWGDGDIG
jgi:hypothetical protein